MGSLKKEESVKEGDLVDSPADLDGIAVILKGLVEPFSKAQETSELESTKRAHIVADVTKKVVYALLFLAIMLIGLAAYSIYQENGNLAENIVIALLSFLGGLGAGKLSR